MARVLTFGEPMGLMVATEPKALKDVTTFHRYVCGAEVNFSVGMSRLGHDMAYISRVGNDHSVNIFWTFWKNKISGPIMLNWTM